MRTLPATSLLALALTAAPAWAQDVPAPAPEPAPADSAGEEAHVTGNQIIVSAQSLRGTVDTPAPPVLELNPEHRVRQQFHHLAAHLEEFFFGHAVSVSLSGVGRP